MLYYKKIFIGIGLIIVVMFQSCVPTRSIREASKTLPDTYKLASADTVSSATTSWDIFFKDPNLKTLIEKALANNQELNIMLQQIAMAKNEVKARKGEYLPFVNLRAGAEVEKVGKYTRNGAVEENLDIKEDTRFPDPLPNYDIGLMASWELDVWKKLRNSKKAALMEYFGSMEGKNFLVTNLVAEIAASYYELLALDNRLNIINQNLNIQQDALKIVKQQKQAGETTLLAVKRFEAEVLKNKSERYQVKQEIIEAENKINYLLGRQSGSIERNTNQFIETTVDSVLVGVPANLLQYRPDIRQAEYEIAAAKLNVKVARANFYPSFGIRAGVGLEAFKPRFLTTTPSSLLYGFAADAVAPLINRNAIKAVYNTANNKQLAAVFEYEKTVLNAYLEVSNALSNIANLKQSYDLKLQQVAALNESIEISSKLFQSARADYMEVLLTQRDALDAKIDLVETKRNQFLANVAMYKSLGGGWK